MTQQLIDKSEKLVEFLDSIQTFNKLNNNNIVIEKTFGPSYFAWNSMNIELCEFWVYASIKNERNKKKFNLEIYFIDKELYCVILSIQNAPDSKNIFLSMKQFEKYKKNHYKKLKHDKLELLTGETVDYFEIILDNLDDFIELYTNHIMNNIY